MTIGRYRLLRTLAVGGMAELHLAIDEGSLGLSKLVALKRMRPRFAGNALVRSMFIDEAKLASHFGHRGLLDVLELCELDGQPFYAMRYIPGADLRAVLRQASVHRRPMPLEVVAHAATEIAAALHYAHELRDTSGSLLEVVHRDVSTANVRIGLSGAIYLLDFGVAKSRMQSIATQAGVTKGNASYMAPEQCLGRHLDRRVDVFALGILLYEMVTTRRLFSTRRPDDTMLQICSGPILSPSALRPQLPASLERIIMRALERDPSRRFDSAQQMSEALGAVMDEQGWSAGSSALARYLGSLFQAPRCPADPVEAYPAPDFEEVITLPTSTTISLAS